MNIPNSQRQRRTSPVPAEGQGGVFTQSWFPICRSEDIEVGQVRGFSFLDGRVIVFRGENGQARVMSAYCPHLGADLAVGRVVDNEIECRFHQWTFDQDGMCSGLKTGEPVPKKACVFNFPCREKFGVIWAFNGNEATWEIPDFELPDSELSFRVEYDNPIYPVDPWAICANTPDWQHLLVTHRMKFDPEELYDNIKWTDNSMEYYVKGELDEGAVDMTLAIHGTSIFTTVGVFGGVPGYTMVAFGIPKPGFTQAFFILGVPKGDGSPETIQRNKDVLQASYDLSLRITGDDRPILHTARYVPGHLTRVDRALGRYLDMVRTYPRAHPSAEFIR